MTDVLKHRLLQRSKRIKDNGGGDEQIPDSSLYTTGAIHTEICSLGRCANMRSFAVLTAQAVATADRSGRGKLTPLLTRTLECWGLVFSVG